jgi:HSP20 family protein
MYLVPVTRHPAAIFRSFDRLFDDVFGSVDHGRPASRVPALDVAETDKDYTVTLDMPGVAKDQVSVSIDGKLVKVEAKTQTEDEKKDGDRIVYRERSTHAFARSFKLAGEIDQAASSAKLENGVLTLTLAKRVPNGAAQLTVN